MGKSHRVAIVQLKSSSNKEENLKISVDFIKEAAKRKARLICFPEFQMAFSPAQAIFERIGGDSRVSEKRQIYLEAM